MKKELIICIWIFITALNNLLTAGEIGVSRFDEKNTSDCYRLVSSRNLETAHLISPKGRYVHSWTYPHTDKQTSNFSGFGMTWHYTEMLPNGNLVAIIKDEMIIELDWNSNLVWKANLRAHHDFARTDNGNTIVVSRRDIENPWQSGSTIAIDELVEYDQSGNIIWNWHFEDHLQEIANLAKQPLPPHKSFRDWPHINTCEILPENPIANKDKRFSAGNLLMCGRHANTIFIIDKADGKVVWAWGPGELEGPHMPTMLKNGNILIYDNGHHVAETSRKYTRIIELDPLSGKIVWQYTANPKTDFFSPSRGSANRLNNGNTLIAESDSGHLFEINPKKEIVWDYWNMDFKDNGDRMPLYRTIPYDKKLVDELLAKYGAVKDVIPEQKESLVYQKDLGPDAQYKQMIREVVFYTEIGYYDNALKFLDDFMTAFPKDPEGYYAYSLVYSARHHPQAAYEYMIKAIDAGLSLGRFTSGPKTLFKSLQEYGPFQLYVRSQNHMLDHGPMLGNVTDMSAQFWVRTFGERDVQVIARQQGDLDFILRSIKVRSKADMEYTAVMSLSDLQPQTTFEYKLIIDGFVQDKIFTFTTFAEKGQPTRFETGFGGGAGYTPHYEYMWDTIRSHQLPFFMLLGDNVYIDHPERPATQQYCYYRRQSRPEFKRFSAGTAVYSIWDDHDFTFNDGKGSPEIDEPFWKPEVWRLYKNQWVNPAYGGGEEQPGCWYTFSYGDVDFFMLDCRYYREQPDGNPSASMLGNVQKQWLYEQLKASKAVFKVIASSVPWAQNTKPGSLDTWDGHPKEREEIFKYIENNKIEGVVLISADRHRSDAWRIERPNGYDLYDFESSKLTNIHTHNIMKGSLFGYNKTCSVGLLEFDTTCKDPKVVYRILSIDNEEIYRITFYKSQLSFPDD